MKSQIDFCDSLATRTNTVRTLYIFFVSELTPFPAPLNETETEPPESAASVRPICQAVSAFTC